MTEILQCGVTLASGDLAMYEAGARRVQIIAPDGSRYVAEWLIGGRTTKLRRLAA